MNLTRKCLFQDGHPGPLGMNVTVIVGLTQGKEHVKICGECKNPRTVKVMTLRQEIVNQVDALTLVSML